MSFEVAIMLFLNKFNVTILHLCSLRENYSADVNFARLIKNNEIDT